MSINVVINPGKQQFYNNTWYVGGQSVTVDNVTESAWITGNIAQVTPNTPIGLIENFPSTAAFLAAQTPGVAAVGQ